MLEEKFVLNNVVSGTVLAHDGLGALYQGILPMTDIGPADNLLIINPLSFSYQSLDSIVDQIVVALPKLRVDGRMILNIDLFFVIYDRINVSIDSLTQQFITKLQCHDMVVQSKLLLKQTPPGYGQLFLSFDRVQ